MESIKYPLIFKLENTRKGEIIYYVTGEGAFYAEMHKYRSKNCSTFKECKEITDMWLEDYVTPFRNALTEIANAPDIGEEEFEKLTRLVLAYKEHICYK